jgi:type I restriction enzyme S subunit
MAAWQPCDKQGWKRMQAKRAFEIVLGKMLQPAPNASDEAEVPYLKALHVHWGHICLDELPTMWAAPWEVHRLALRAGDLLVCEGGEVGRAARLRKQPPERCIIQNALHRVRGKDIGDVGFLSYCLKQAAEKGWFEVLCNRATIAHFTVEKFSDLWLNLPSLEEQRRIAAFLDLETAQIDNLVKEKNRLLGLIQIKREAIVTKAVTEGIDPRATHKPSSLEWLREIPAHWEGKRAKRLFTEIDDRSETGEETLLSLRMERGLVPHNEVSEKPIPAENLIGYKIAQPNEIVLNRMRAASGLVAVTPQHGIVSPDYAVFRALNGADPEYFTLLFKTPLLQAVFRSLSKGLGTGQSGFLRLYSEDFLSIKLPVPPLEEQKAIVAELARERARTAEVEAALEDSIKLLKERRAALITAAVTGQIQPEAMAA